MNVADIETQYTRLRDLVAATLAAHPAIEEAAKKRRQDLSLADFADALDMIKAGRYFQTHLGAIDKHLCRYAAANPNLPNWRRFGALAAAARDLGNVMTQHANGKDEHAAYNLAKVVTPMLDKAAR